MALRQIPVSGVYICFTLSITINQWICSRNLLVENLSELPQARTMLPSMALMFVYIEIFYFTWPSKIPTPIKLLLFLFIPCFDLHYDAAFRASVGLLVGQHNTLGIHQQWCQESRKNDPSKFRGYGWVQKLMVL